MTLASSPFVQRVRGELGYRPPRREPRLARLVDVDAHEGPVFCAEEEALYFTTVPRSTPAGPVVAVKRMDLRTLRVTVVRADANVANGMCLDRDGALLVCEQGTRFQRSRIARMDRHTGETQTVTEAWQGHALNSPNDVVVHCDGSIWFTDPAYGWLQGFRPLPQLPGQVYRHDPRTGRTTVVARGLDKPNGLAFSPDERTLYVADNGDPHELLAFETHGTRLRGRRRVAVTTPGHPDGLKVDHLGRIFHSTARGIEVRSPSGAVLREIRLPGAVNFAFGGDALFITTDTAIWQAKGA